MEPLSPKLEEESSFHMQDWSRYYDDEHHTYYYVHDPTGHTQWELPSGPPAETKTLEENPSVENIRFIKSSSFENPALYTPWGLVPEHSSEPAEKTLEVNPSAEQFRFIRSSSFEHPTSYAPWGMVPENCPSPDMNNSDEEDPRPRQQRRRSVCDEHGIRWIGSEDFVEDRGRFMSLESVMSDLDTNHEHGDHVGVFSDDEEGEFEFHRDNVVIKRQTVVYPGGKNQDYLGLAKLYKLQRPYSNPNYNALCLLCRTNYAEDVFFPCEHHCVCRACIEKENICEEKMLRKNPHGYCNCSLCASIIKLILPLEGGKEIEKYWNWVYEEKAELPKGFMKDFRHSGAVIQAVYIDDKHQLKTDQHNSSFCCIA